MKKSWLSAVALALGCISCPTTFGQYPNVQNNFGPSSYPVQQPQMQSVLQTLPQVPAGNPYQLVNVQDPTAIYSLPSNQAVPQQQPTVPPQMGQAPNSYPQAGVCPTCPAPAVQYQQPVDYGYQQYVAPSCNSCGPAPVSNMVAPSYLSNSFAGGCGGGYGSEFTNTGGHFGGGRLAALPSGAKPWFFGAGGLLFNRVDNQNVGLTFLDSNYGPNLITSRDARMDLTGGVEASVGRYFNCGKNAIQASYWGLFPTDQVVYQLAATPGNYQTRIPFTYMEMPPTPLPISGYYNDSGTAFQAHQLTRSSTFNNIEVNLLGFAMGCSSRNFNMSTAGTLFSHAGSGRGHAGCGYCGGAGCGACSASCGSSCGSSCGGCSTCGQDAKFATGPCCLTAPSCGSRLNLTWLGGFRYFRFTDNFLYASSTDDAFINRSATDMYYEVNTTNDLFGFQFGSRADYCLGKRLNVYGSAKVGVYNNRSTLYSRLGTDTDNAYLNDTRPPVNPNNGVDYLFNETKNDIAILSELGSGFGYRLSPKWTATVGYRVVAVSGVATAPDNVRSTFANYDAIRDFDNRGSLILHGMNLGAIYNY